MILHIGTRTVRTTCAFLSAESPITPLLQACLCLRFVCLCLLKDLTHNARKTSEEEQLIQWRCDPLLLSQFPSFLVVSLGVDWCVCLEGRGHCLFFKHRPAPPPQPCPTTPTQPPLGSDGPTGNGPQSMQLQ